MDSVHHSSQNTTARNKPVSDTLIQVDISDISENSYMSAVTCPISAVPGPHIARQVEAQRVPTPQLNEQQAARNKPVPDTLILVDVLPKTKRGYAL